MYVLCTRYARLFRNFQESRKKCKKSSEIRRFRNFPGGDKRDRTADLLNAIQALSQLSYTPRFYSLRGALAADLLSIVYFRAFVNTFFSKFSVFLFLHPAQLIKGHGAGCRHIQ